MMQTRHPSVQASMNSPERTYLNSSPLHVADVKNKALNDGKAAAKATPAALESETEPKKVAKDSATPQTHKIAITATGNAKAAGKGEWASFSILAPPYPRA